MSLQLRLLMVVAMLSTVLSGCAPSRPAGDGTPTRNVEAGERAKRTRERGEIDHKIVGRTIRRRAAAFQTCYENGLRNNPDLRGSIELEFTVNRRGLLSEAHVIRDGIGSEEVTRCIIRVLKRLRYPQPVGGEATVSNTFVFSPGG